MRILAIDTTSEQGSIALVEEHRVVEEIVLHSQDGFAHILFDEIGKLLVRHELSLGDIDVFASASGPGAFTGVRVGLTAVKGLAEAAGRRVVAVSNLRALASFGTRELRAVMIDARRGEIYGAVYDSSLEIAQEEVVMKEEAWLTTLPAGVEIVTQPRPLAGAIGRIAVHEVAAGRAQDPAEIDANYVRRSDAELLWTDPLLKHKTR